MTREEAYNKLSITPAIRGTDMYFLFLNSVQAKAFKTATKSLKAWDDLVSDIEEYMDAFPVYYDGDTVYNRELQEACEHILELIHENLKEVEK